MSDYRYELRRGDEVIATGHFSREQPLEVGERITIGSRSGIVQARFPEANGTLNPGRTVWNGVLRPTPLSRSYRVEISYRALYEPSVRVLDVLETREGNSLPPASSIAAARLPVRARRLERQHVPGRQHRPMDGRMARELPIWLATGDWHGGGEWPPPRRQMDDATDSKDLPTAR